MTSSQLAAPPTLRLPREHRVPDRGRTWGPEARELAELAGIFCQPWQALVIDDMLGERPDSKWAARESGLTVARQNGKSVIAEVRILAGLYLLGEELIVYTAHQVSTAEEVFERLVDKIEHCPDLRHRHFKTSRARGDKGITLHSPRQRLLVKARSEQSVRGFSADLIFLDEAQMGLNEDDMAALGPTQRTRPNPQTVYMGTPPRIPGTYWGKLRRRALAGDAKVAWHGWTPRPRGEQESVDAWRRDREIWRETNPALGSLMTEEAIEHDLKTLGDSFDAEALCAWPAEPEDAGWDVFTEAAWEAAQDPHSTIAGPLAFAIESSHDLAWLSIGVAGRRKDALRHLELVDRFPADTAKLVGWLKKRLREWKPVAVVIDPNGPAGYLISEVERHCGIEVVKPMGRDVAAACGSVYTGISGQEAAARDVRVRVSPLSEHVDEAARRVVWRDRGDVRVFDIRDDAADVSPLRAMTLADWGMANSQPISQPASAPSMPGDSREFFRPSKRLDLGGRLT